MSARLLIAGLVLLCACAEAPTTSNEPVEVSAKETVPAVVVDVALASVAEERARDGFFFLSPLVSGAAYSGQFDGTLLPYLTVEMCRLGPTGCVVPAITTLSGTPRVGAETIRLDALGEQYIVNWDTKDLKLDPIPNYRVTVLAVGRPIGHLDLDVVSTNAELKRVDAGQFVGLVAGRPLQIRFRIEQGGFAVVGPAGGTASLARRQVEIGVPPGALPAPIALFVDPVVDEAVEVTGLIPGTVFDITPSGTALVPPARLSIRYDESALGNVPESGLTVLKKLGAVWVEADDAVIDPAANAVSVQLDGFSRWALGCKVVELLLQPGSADLNLRHAEVKQLSATPGCATTGASKRLVQNRRIEWSSSAPTIASADAGTGLVAALRLGQAGVTASLPRACQGRWPTVPPNAGPCTPFTSSAVPVSVFAIVVQLAGAGGQPWQRNLRWLGATRLLTASVVREPDGLPVSQAVEWTSTTGAASVSENGLVTGVAVGSAAITATSAVDPLASAFAPATVIDGIRLTAADLVGDINGLSKSYTVEEWDGMDYPYDFDDRGINSHLQGIARVGPTWILTHSRDDYHGLMVYGTNRNWTFAAPPGPDLGHHPGGIQASGTVVVVPSYTNSPKRIALSFFRPFAGGLQELSHLRLVLSDDAKKGEAAGIGYHPVEDRWYVINGANANYGVATHPLFRTRPGLALTDPANCFLPDDTKDCSLESDAVKATPYKSMTAFGSQGAMQLIWDEKTQQMALVALYRDNEECLECQNEHAIAGTWLNVSNPTVLAGIPFGTRSDFDFTDNVAFTPTFRYASGLLLDANGRVTFIGTERCTSFEARYLVTLNALPCELSQDVVDYFILQPPNLPRAPAAPTAFVATAASATQVNLTWTDASTNELGFGIERRQQGADAWGAWSPSAATVANVTTTAVTGLTPGAIYQFRVNACNLAGCSKTASSGSITMPTP